VNHGQLNILFFFANIMITRIFLKISWLWRICSLWALFFLTQYPMLAQDCDFLFTDSKSNSIYLGIDNRVRLKSFPLGANLVLQTDNGMVFKAEDDFFVLIPVRPGRILLRAINIVASCDTMLVCSSEMIVSRFPQPALVIDSIRYSDGADISIAKLLMADSVGIYFTDDIIGIDEWYKVSGFTLGYFYGNYFISYESESNRFTEPMREALRKLFPGNEITFRFELKSNSDITMKRPIMKFRLH